MCVCVPSVEYSKCKAADHVSSNNSAMVSLEAKPRGPKSGGASLKKRPGGQFPIFEFEPKFLLG